MVGLTKADSAPRATQVLSSPSRARVLSGVLRGWTNLPYTWAKRKRPSAPTQGPALLEDTLSDRCYLSLLLAPAEVATSLRSLAVAAAAKPANFSSLQGHLLRRARPDSGHLHGQVLFPNLHVTPKSWNDGPPRGAHSATACDAMTQQSSCIQARACTGELCKDFLNARVTGTVVTNHPSLKATAAGGH